MGEQRWIALSVSWHLLFRELTWVCPSLYTVNVFVLLSNWGIDWAFEIHPSDKKRERHTRHGLDSGVNRELMSVLSCDDVATFGLSNGALLKVCVLLIDKKSMLSASRYSSTMSLTKHRGHSIHAMRICPTQILDSMMFHSPLFHTWTQRPHANSNPLYCFYAVDSWRCLLLEAPQGHNQKHSSMQSHISLCILCCQNIQGSWAHLLKCRASFNATSACDE